MMTITTCARRSGLSGALLLLGLVQGAAAQHPHEPAIASAAAVHLGAHAVPLITHVSPILLGESKTEAYLTQPTLLADAHAFGGMLRAHAAISLEAWTLERGELGAGNYGEGYIDRRHPHTYLHELMLSAARDVGPLSASAAIGRGFAPFGTDDPMMRPFIKFPVNHHLAQILERLVVIGAARAGPVTVEAGVFNGNEPVDAKDNGSLDRLGDSWAARVTFRPRADVELQASRASVESPELPSGGGADQRKWSASARYESGSLYGLAEWARTVVADNDRALYAVRSVLIEVAAGRDGWRPALRLEHSERGEDPRGFDPFRTQWPHPDTHLMGITTWTIAAARVEKALAVAQLRVAPFVEASYAHVRGGVDDPFVPAEFYGDTDIWTLNAGARMSFGAHRPRMGRYGVAAHENP